MTEFISMPNAIDEHIGQRIYLRRNMMGMTQTDLARRSGVTFQQIQKYENASNRITASRLFLLSLAMETPVAFFFQGLPGNIMPQSRTKYKSYHVGEPESDDPLAKNESLELINLYWKLSSDSQRKVVMQMLLTLNGMI